MKKKKFTLLLLFLTIAYLTGFSQYYYTYTIGGNPGGLNTDLENPAASLKDWGRITELDSAGTAVSFSRSIALPFSFKFNGVEQTHFKVSNSGIVTFDTSATTPPAYANITLPNAQIPPNSVCVLGIKPFSSGNYTSAVITKVYGTAPNRQYWIQFNFFSEPNIQNGWTYWSVVLEETSNKIYLVDMKTLCVTPASQRCNSNVKISAGIQIDSATAYTVSGSPNVAANNIETNLFTTVDNKYYEFTHGIQPAYDLRGLKAVFTKDILVNTPFSVTMDIQNTGINTITKAQINYSVDGGAVVSDDISGLNVATSGIASLTSTKTWIPSTQAVYTIKVWASSPNDHADENIENDTISFTVNVWDNFTARRSLYELLTSSTCPPCKPGNEQLHAVLKERVGKYAVIKYQAPSPGTGDPYFTMEGYARDNYYNTSIGVPHMYIDGGWSNNPIGFTTQIFDEFQSKPAFLEITPTLTVTDQTVNVSATIKSLINLPSSSYSVRMAIVSKKDVKNVKTNGEKEFFYVMKKMLPNASGRIITLPAKDQSITLSETYTFPGSYRLPLSAITNSGNYAGIDLTKEHTVEDFDNLAVVVFVQNNNTKEVMQAAWTAQDFPVGVEETIKNKQSNFVIYPNPANTYFEVVLENAKVAKVRVLDINGREVTSADITPDNSRIDCSSFNNGLYFVEIEVNGKATVQKLSIGR